MPESIPNDLKMFNMYLKYEKLTKHMSSSEFVNTCRKIAIHKPVMPAKKTRIGKMVNCTPIALSRPCTGNGTWQSNQR